MKKGFTLIELLVVVLIIGILSGVALPQYEKAVTKARLTEGLAIMPSVERACSMWRMENPDVTGTSDEMFKAGGVKVDDSSKFSYGVAYNGATATCVGGARFPAGSTPEGAEMTLLYKRVGTNAGTRTCCAMNGSSKGKTMCDAAKTMGYSVGTCTPADLSF